MKKLTILLASALLLALLAAGCGQTDAPAADASGPQTASAWLANGDEATRTDVTIDLSGGWSVDFAAGAFYLYQSGQSTDEDCSAMGLSLSEEVFGEYMDEAEQSDSRTEVDGAVRYTDESDGSTVYLFTAGENGYFYLTVNQGLDGDGVFGRVSLGEEAPAA